MADDRPGYTDTPYLPDSEYHVHDPERPEPPAVEPRGPVEKAPPADATVLFDGSDLSAWEHPDGRDAEWAVEGDAVVVEPGTGAIQTATDIGDCQLHIEWATPEAVEGEGQGRGNSGVFLMEEYEVQVLDSHENPTYADGYAAAIYGQRPPLVNASRPPGEWQSYDVVWRGPRFDGDDLARPARLTLLHNGVVVHDAVELIGPTTHRGIEEYEPHPPAAPLRLQDHGDRVRFRNVWYRSLE
ncbi:MAG: DUF1080 domain-containing protein [Halobacteriaceae archaeon]